ncbi:MAG: phage tail assembly protein [Pseudomonadota bacterium]
MSKEVPLEDPIERKDETIKAVMVNKPSAGQLRGLKLVDVLQMDVNAMITLLPRITSPALLPDEVANLDPADLTSLSTEVVVFLAGNSKLQELGQG